MHRKLRWSILEQCNHFMSRGNRREDIFLDDVDRHDFLEILAEACQKTGWQVHAFCLMSDHYHAWCWKLPTQIWWREYEKKQTMLWFDKH